MSTSHTVESHIKIGERVETADNNRGTCRYIGTVPELGAGIFVGIELDNFTNDGNDGLSYFKCNNGYGVFLIIEEVTKLHEIEINNEFEAGYNHHQYINSSELDTEQALKTLNRAFKKRKSQLELERSGVVPPNYFSDPIATTKNINFGHEMVGSSLSEWLPQRPHKQELESRNIVPPNYFEDPIASTKGKSLVKQMISSNLETFHSNKRPTLDELQMRNIIHSDFCDNDIEEAHNLKHQRDKEREETLNQKLNHKKRPTITDLGDMHIIPHDYLDNLLEDAVAHHTRKESRMNHVQDRLEKHLPQPVAATLAETLVTSVQEDTNNEDNDNDANDTMNEKQLQQIEDNEDDEWQISFVYEPMQNFVPMNPAQKDEVTNKLERRLSLRPSKQQIEVWGFVPPQYFESPEQSFLRQALGREIALDLLEGFFPKREDIYQLTNRGIMHPDFIGRDHNEALKQQHERKKSVMDELNQKLDPRRRPSIGDLSQQGLIPENWLLDLYGLADQVRKRHKKMDSAVMDLKSQLNVPPILADVVARDVLDEIETVDPYLKPSTNNNDNDHEMDMNMNQRRDSIDNNEIQKQIEELKDKIQNLSSANNELQNTINRMKEVENKHLVQINNLQKKTSIINDQSEEINRLREEQNSTELHRLDAKAIEIELSRERKNTQRLQEINYELENKLNTANYKINVNEKLMKQLQNDKIILLNKTNEQINVLRDYLISYQKYIDRMNENKKNQSMFTNIFG